MRPHGYARYRLDGCRCYECGWARSEYDSRRDQAIRDGQWKPFIIVGPARRHIDQLRELGYGDRSIAALAGLNRKVVRDIRLGVRHDPSRGNPTLTLIRTATAAAILAIPCTLDELPDGAKVDAAPTWALIDDLIARGWTRTAIAQEAGLGRSIQLARDRVTVRNARRIARTHEAATRRGLDVEEVELLIGTDTAESIARRLGYTLPSLERILARVDRGDLVTRMHGRAA